MKYGTFQNFSQTRPQVDLYVTLAHALLQSSDVLNPLGAEKFVSDNRNAAAIQGLWEAPA